MLLTVLAVVLGTAFISGSFILTKSMESTYNQAVNGANAGTDVIVQADYKDGRIIAEQWENIKALPGVAHTRMADKQYVVLGTEDAKALPTRSTLLGPWTPSNQYKDGKNPVTILEGKEPGNGEILVSEASAKIYGLTLG